MECHSVDAEQKMKAATCRDRLLVVEPVQWGEQDLLGHVNHVTYFRWYELARIAYFLKVGLMDMHKNERIGPIQASVANDYRRQIAYPDTVHIGYGSPGTAASSIDMEHKIFSRTTTLAPPRAPRQAGHRLRDQEVCPVPARIRRAIENHQSRTF